jgi:hypothetical protein
MLQPKNKFKPIVGDSLVPTPPVHRDGQGAASALRPRPEDVPALVKSETPRSFWVECTPEIMRACLALNKENYRPMMPDWRNQIQSDMAAKPTRFKQAGDPVRFDVDGIMIDAQHRFEAGSAANFTFVFLFVIGLPKEAREVIDFLRPRKVAHVVRNMGYDNAYMLASAAGWLCKFKKGQSTDSGLTRGRNGGGTTEEILDTIKRHPRLHASTVMCKQAGRQPVPGSLLASVHYIAAVCLNKPELANSFCWELWNYPKKARQRAAPFAWVYEIEQREQRGLSIARDFKARGTVEAWNLYMQGIEIEDSFKIPDKCTFKDLDYDVL